MITMWTIKWKRYKSSFKKQFDMAIWCDTLYLLKLFLKLYKTRPSVSYITNTLTFCFLYSSYVSSSVGSSNLQTGQVFVWKKRHLWWAAGQCKQSLVSSPSVIVNLSLKLFIPSEFHALVILRIDQKYRINWSYPVFIFNNWPKIKRDKGPFKDNISNVKPYFVQKIFILYLMIR